MNDDYGLQNSSMRMVNDFYKVADDLVDANRIFLSGIVSTDFIFSHNEYVSGVGDKAYYSFNLQTSRETTDMFDDITIFADYDTINNAFIQYGEIKYGDRLNIAGRIVSYHMDLNGRSKLCIAVKANDMIPYEKHDIKRVYTNKAIIEGYFSRPAPYFEKDDRAISRMSPNGNWINGGILASNREGGETDYIPFVVWSLGAKLLEKCSLGQKCKLIGRFQSRTYKRKNRYTGEQFLETTHELSANRLFLFDENSKTGLEDQKIIVDTWNMD